MAAKRSNPDQFQLRLPPGLRDRIKAVAETNNRSMNAEIVARLAKSFEHQDHVEIPEHLGKRIAAEAAAKGRTMRYEIFRTLVDRYPAPDYVAIEEELLNSVMARPLDKWQMAAILRRIRRRIIEEDDLNSDAEDDE